MRTVDFAEANAEVGCMPSARDYGADRDDPVTPLRAHVGDGEVISLWRPSWRERLSVLVFGRVWLRLLTGGGGPQPACVEARRTVFERAAEPSR